MGIADDGHGSDAEDHAECDVEDMVEHGCGAMAGGEPTAQMPSANGPQTGPKGVLADYHEFRRQQAEARAKVLTRAQWEMHE